MLRCDGPCRNTSARRSTAKNTSTYTFSGTYTGNRHQPSLTWHEPPYSTYSELANMIPRRMPALAFSNSSSNLDSPTALAAAFI